VIRGALLDAEGRPIGKDFTKSFRTTAEDRQRSKLEDWKLTAPRSGTREPATLLLPKSLDHRSLGNCLTIEDASGKKIAGTIEIDKEEKSWSFRPTQPWSKQEYRLTVDGRCEDVAGNTPRQAFDVDLKATPPRAVQLDRTFRPIASKTR
jgi:hypothetical protein